MIDKLKENFNEYNLKARVYPAVIALFPVFLFLYFSIHDLAKLNVIISVLSSSAFTVIALYLLSDIVRNLGKFVEIKIFKNELYFPTTEFLLHTSSELSENIRIQIYDKLEKDYNCTLCSPEEEKRDEKEARQSIKEGVGLVRQKMGDGRLILSFNIRYGFWRNLIGISLFSFAFCILSLMLFLINKEYVICLIFFIISLPYLVIFIFRKELLKFFGYQYANQLFLEYLSLK